LGKNNFTDHKDILETYFRQVKTFALLSFDEELELSRRIQEGDSLALDKLINANLRLVAKIAKFYCSPDVSIEDLIQEGNLGLIQAAKKYDYNKNVRFCTYASWWIKQSVCRYLSNKHRLVRLPQQKEEVLRKIQRTYHALSQTLMSQPSNTEIADELGISVQEVDNVINMSSGPLSLEPGYNEGENSPVPVMHEENKYCPERNLLRKSSRDGTRRILNRLKESEKWVLIYRFQLNGCCRHTLREISNKLDISPETVRQIEIRALKKMRTHANDLMDCVYTEAI